MLLAEALLALSQPTGRHSPSIPKGPELALATKQLRSGLGYCA